MKTIFDQLRQEHVRMRELVREAEELTDLEKRNGMLEELEASILPHAKGEEMTLYAAMEKISDLRVDALEAVDEHVLIERAFFTLQGVVQGDDGEWRAAANVLRETVEHHLKEEEEKAFPRAEKILNPETQASLLEAYLRFRTSTGTA